MKNQEFIGKGIKNLVKGSPNANVINILRSIIEDENCICYIPFDYAKEKSKTTDSKIHFNPIESGKTIVAKSIVSNQERFNFSINGEVDVYVEYENEDGTIRLEPKKIYRTYTIVRDGKLTIDYVIAKLSEETFNDLRHAGVLYYNGVPVADNHCYIKDFLYKIKFTDLPIVSYAWAQPLQIGWYKNMETENLLANTLSEVNKLIKKFKAEGQTVPSFPEDSIYYAEPYSPSEKTGDTVECECIVYEIPNDKKVADEYINRCTNIIEATKIKKEINSELRNLRFINRCVAYAIECSSTKGNFNWSELTLVPRSKEKYFQTTEVAGIGKMYELKRTVYKKKF